MALATFEVVVNVLPDKFWRFPAINVPLTPASFASGHPSPSESKSSQLLIPSPSTSKLQVRSKKYAS